MSHTHTIGYTTRFQEDTEAQVTSTATTTITDDIEINLTPVVAASTETEYAVAIDVSELSSIFIQADQSVTINVNDLSTGSPVASHDIDLDANVAYIWNTDSTGSNPWSTDVTSLAFKNNSTTTTTTIKFRTLCGG